MNKKNYFLGLMALGFLACTQTTKNASDLKPAENRKLSSADSETEKVKMLEDEAPSIVYITYRKNGQALEPEIANLERWATRKPTYRYDVLTKAYYANTRERSLDNVRHAACFTGHAEAISKTFFAPAEGHKIANIKNEFAVATPSSDGHMLSISFVFAKGPAEFKLHNCDSGKAGISEDAGPAQEVTKLKANPKRKVANSFDKYYGFRILDQEREAPVAAPKGPLAESNDSKLPRFELRADFEKAHDYKEERPWAGLNLRDQVQAMRFALMAQKHFYENMANQNKKNKDLNFIAQNNKSRFWCHMPWMNVGITGRETVHGLTQERDMKASTLIPVFRNATAGTNWGVAYFNAAGCKTLEEVFGSVNNPKEVPNWSAGGQFKDGTMITKILFTTADFPELEGAYQWKANVSLPGSTSRSVRTVRHIQMDIAVRDSKLGGVDADLQDWAMAGYYYDPNYDYEIHMKPYVKMENPLKDIPDLPPELLRMRPMGVQSGFDSPSKTTDSIIFPGAFANGSGGRLNGPADNPRSSCMGCHGQAGTSASMVPGFLSKGQFQSFIGKPNLDFNQQLALAKRNFETHQK